MNYEAKEKKMKTNALNKFVKFMKKINIINHLEYFLDPEETVWTKKPSQASL